ncbi:ATP-binding protein [Streptacidiphilus sp. N1-10]|uniref:ATP-binding protein n=1 Tax=Streptacidiphilus jeojiensis TaxID=3229225 RepID=A0ABV6XS30_9ACTN
MSTDRPGADLRVRSSRLPLSGAAGTSPRARDHTRAFLEHCSPPLAPEVLDDVLIASGELVSNALRHAPGPCVLRLTDDGSRLTVAVSDSSTEAPVPRRPDLTAGGGGFGWHLLLRIAADVEVDRDPLRGKTITVTVPARSPTCGRSDD